MCCMWTVLHAKSFQLCQTRQPYGLWPTKLLCQWDFPGKNTEVGCHFLLQGIFSTEGSKLCFLCLLHWEASSLPLSSVQSLSRVWLFETPWIVARQASLSSQTPRVCSNSCPLSQWCHPAISSSVGPFSSCPQSLPASGSFLMSQLFTWGG